MKRRKRPTSCSVTGARCKCKWLDTQSKDPDSHVVFDSALNEFNIRRVDGGISRIYHCPFCGGAAPRSRRQEEFAVVTEAERRRLEKLLRGFSTLENAIRSLGKPDEVVPFGWAISLPAMRESPPQVRYSSVARYTRLSATADVDLWQDPISGYTFSFAGKVLDKVRVRRRRDRRPRSTGERR